MDFNEDCLVMAMIAELFSPHGVFSVEVFGKGAGGFTALFAVAASFMAKV